MVALKQSEKIPSTGWKTQKVLLWTYFQSNSSYTDFNTSEKSHANYYFSNQLVSKHSYKTQRNEHDGWNGVCVYRWGLDHFRHWTACSVMTDLKYTEKQAWMAWSSHLSFLKFNCVNAWKYSPSFHLDQGKPAWRNWRLCSGFLFSYLASWLFSKSAQE